MIEPAGHGDISAAAMMASSAEVWLAAA